MLTWCVAETVAELLAFIPIIGLFVAAPVSYFQTKIALMTMLDSFVTVRKKINKEILQNV